MRTHPYLRAYMAGIVVPTIFMLVIVTVFATWRSSVLPLAPQSDPTPPETLWAVVAFEAIGRAIIFPMAVVPNLWGLWNILYLALGARTRISLGLFGALLPILIVPFGVVLANAMGIFRFEAQWVIPFAATAMVAYYLVWKHAVGFLNAEMGIA